MCACEQADRRGGLSGLPLLHDYRLNPLTVKQLNRERIGAAQRNTPIWILDDWRLHRPTGAAAAGPWLAA
jgi:hypothetical protein